MYRSPKTHNLQIERCIEEGWRRQDSPAVPQLALPVTVSFHMAESAYATTSAEQQAIGDLGLTGFYYLLRVGEYTKPRTTTLHGRHMRATRTIQFHIKDVGFFKDGKILPRKSPLPVLLSADQATLKITNQKNGRMGETITHETVSNQTHGSEALQCSIHVIGSSAVGEWWATIQCQWYESDWYRKLLATDFFAEEIFVG